MPPFFKPRIPLAQLALLFVVSVAAQTKTLASEPNLPDTVERVLDGVVNIQTSEDNETLGTLQRNNGASPDGLFGYLNSGAQKSEKARPSHGTGFFFKNRNFVVTNYHVVKDAKFIQVATNRKKWLPANATLYAYDERTDIAILKIRNATDATTTLKFAPSAQARLGDPVFVIGNPRGFGHTVTTGILSAKGRTIGAGPYNDFLQTDAAMNPGNSGGPLFNQRGEVIGICTATAPGTHGISFAIPSEIAEPIVESIIKNGEYYRPQLGAFVSDVTEPGTVKAQHFGIFINKIVPNSPAHRAGLKAGDIILGINGKQVRDIPDLQATLNRARPGTTLSLGIFRTRKTTSVKVVLGHFQKNDSPYLGSDEF